MPHKRNPNTPEMVSLALSGISMIEIAEKFKISKQRVKQILSREGCPPTPKIKQQKRAEKYFAKWGNRDTSDLYAVCRDKFRRKKANSHKHEWSVTFGELDWPTHCPVLGIELDYFAESRQENSPSFDRIDSTIGYVTGNVKIISWRANRIKNDGTVEEHEKIIEYLRTRK